MPAGTPTPRLTHRVGLSLMAARRVDDLFGRQRQHGTLDIGILMSPENDGS
jgi:hypothetical protein